MKNIEEIYRMLHWKNDDIIRSEGLRLAKEIKDLSLLILPPAPPSVWECCAQVLCEKTDDALEPYLCGLLDWLQDLNWPGATRILERLKSFSGKRLRGPFLNSFANAHCTKEGLMWLDGLRELLDNEELKAELPKPILEELQRHYENRMLGL